MIERAHRFHGKKSLGLVYGRGQVIREPHLVLKYVQNYRTPEYRVSVVVSRKVSKSAVVRNRIRRRIYEIVRQKEKTLLQHIDMVFIVQMDSLAKFRHKELAQVIEQLLSRARLPGSARPTQTKSHVIVNKEETNK